MGNKKHLIGKLQVIFGPKFSGKTSELIRRVQRYNFTGYKCLVVQYANIDGYCDGFIKTHDGFTLPAISASRLSDIAHLYKDYDVFGIDEGHLFSDIVKFSVDLSDSGKKIVVAALDGTFEKKAYGDILGLIPKAEDITKLNSVCMSCLTNQAPFTKKLEAGHEFETTGGRVDCIPVCKDCYNLLSEQIKVKNINLTQQTFPLVLV